MWCYTFKDGSFKNNTLVSNRATHCPIIDSVVRVCRSTLCSPGEEVLCPPPGPSLGASGLGGRRGTQFPPQNILFYLTYYLCSWTKHPNSNDFCQKCKNLRDAGCLVSSLDSSSSERPPSHLPGLPTWLCVSVPRVQPWSEHQRPSYCLQGLPPISTTACFDAKG